MYHIFIQSSVEGHLGCFLVLTIINCASMNIGGYSYLTIYIYIYIHIYIFINKCFQVFQVVAQKRDWWAIW